MTVVILKLQTKYTLTGEHMINTQGSETLQPVQCCGHLTGSTSMQSANLLTPYGYATSQTYCSSYEVQYISPITGQFMYYSEYIYQHQAHNFVTDGTNWYASSIYYQQIGAVNMMLTQ